MWPAGLTSNEVDKIVKAAEALPEQDATTLDRSEVDRKIRSSKVKWLREEWVRDKLFEFIKEANANCFGVNVENYAELQFTEYHATENGHYDWHHDVDWLAHHNGDRKLSITVQLSDRDEYEGGDFEFRECPTPEHMKAKGTILVFPSFLWHRVSPVTSGVRKSLVAWFYGPRWR
tara:strand:- start:61 stop:585 length:525 start_codon:yes stop_codon:yes gene_type:complete